MLEEVPAGAGAGHHSLVSDVLKMYGSEFRGPLTFGVWWQCHKGADKDAADVVCVPFVVPSVYHSSAVS